jgi:hypothetical protein
VSASIVHRQNLDVFVFTTPVKFFIFDSEVWEMNLVVEVRQIMFRSPDADLLLSPIVVAIVVVAVAVVLVQPLLIVALELVVEDDSLDARTTFM